MPKYSVGEEPKPATPQREADPITPEVAEMLSEAEEKLDAIDATMHERGYHDDIHVANCPLCEEE